MLSKLKSRKLFVSLFLIITTVILLQTTSTTVWAASSSITGYSNYAQTVYTGPSSSYYVSAGSISASEKVYILGSEQGWYHIVYNVSTGSQKSGYVPTNSLNSVSGGNPVEDDFWGGYACSGSNQTVYSCDDYSTKINIGSISTNEGVTRLYEYNSTASNGNTYKVMFIEYSTSSGAKRGYIFNPNFSYPYDKTCVGRVTTGQNVYYGVQGSYTMVGDSYDKAGYIGTGEYVSVIAKNSTYLYVEYNTSVGRKRGIISSNYVQFYNKPSIFLDLPFYQPSIYESPGTTGSYAASQPVYAGPNTTYPIIGYVDNNDYIYMWPAIEYRENGYAYIQYNITGTSLIKTGYIIDFLN